MKGKKRPPSAKAREKEEAHYQQMLSGLEPGWTVDRCFDERGNVTGYIRHPPADDPRNVSHPLHREQWLELARALGRAMARRDFDKAHGKGAEIDKPKSK